MHRRPRTSTTGRSRIPARTAAAFIATTVLTLLAAACSVGSPSPSGSGGSPNSPASTSSPSAVAYSACMRSHGIPNFPDPDPDSGGEVPKVSTQQLGVSTAQFQDAQQACQPAYPNSESFQQETQQCMLTGECPQPLVQQILTVERTFAQCMRSHGVPDWPDPTIDSEGRPAFPLSNVPGHDRSYWRSPQVMSKNSECQQLTGGSPVPVA
jgi:hypothetical protein